MRPSTCLCLILGLISIVYAFPLPTPGSIYARASRGYTITFTPSGNAKSNEDGIVGLLNDVRKHKNINGGIPITKSQVRLMNHPVTVDGKFHFDFTGPMCGKKASCSARGADYEKPTENVVVLSPAGETLYLEGNPDNVNVKPVYVITYSPGRSDGFTDEQLKNKVFELLQAGRKKAGIKGELNLEELEFTNFPPSTTEGELSFTFTGPMCGKGTCTARAKDLNSPTQNAIIEGGRTRKSDGKVTVVFSSGTPPNGEVDCDG